MFITDKEITAASESQEFINFGPVGSFVDLRTYRRWLPELKRRETFYERNARVVNYNCELGIGLQSTDTLEQDSKLMYEYMNKLLALPSGRTMWCGGTDTAKTNPASQLNCSGLAINRMSAFTTLSELLMLGTGVGLRVFQTDVDKLPNIRKDLTVKFQEYFPVNKKSRREDTYVSASDIVFVGDSRQGWLDALSAMLKFYTEGNTKTELTYCFDSVRPMGERLKTFGGTASGPQSLQSILEAWVRVFEELPGNRLRPVDCMDLCCSAASGIVAGSSRRSALITLFDEGDTLIANCKQNIYSDPALEYKRYRQQSNNTMCVGSKNLPVLRAFLEKYPDASEYEVKQFIKQDKPPLQWFKDQFKVIEQTGDPGINNFQLLTYKRWAAARKWRSECPVNERWVKYCDVLTNPCSEIVLSAGFNEDPNKTGQGVSFCNLTTIPLQNHVFVDTGGSNKLDYVTLSEAVKLCVRIGLRQTCIEMGREELNLTQQEERLLGVSATGWRQLFDLMGWSTNSIEVQFLQKNMNRWANDEATRYAEELGVPRPLLVTCIKPEGTLSKVAGSSEGLHWDWAPYSILRVEASGSDALAKTLVEQGFPWYPKPNNLSRLIVGGETVWDKIKLFAELSTEDKKDMFKYCDAVLFEFPLKSEGTTSTGEVSALEQLDNVQSFLNNYTDHMPSSTITVRPNEWAGVAYWVWSNWEDFATAAFLSYWSGNHPLLPKEDITEEQYYALVNSFNSKYRKGNSFVVDEELLAYHEALADSAGVDVDDVDLGAACSSGACPPR